MKRIYAPEPFGEMTADAVVIGGGIVGVATAFWLSKAGMDTVLIEMRDGLSTLTTTVSAECFRVQFPEPAMAQLALESIPMYENFERTVGSPVDIGLVHRGYLFLTSEAGMLPALEKSVRTQLELGVEGSEMIRGEELHRRFPFVAPEALAATFNIRDGWFSTHEATQGLAKAADQARFFIRTKCTGLVLDGKGIAGVQTDKGTIHTRLAVNCAGPFAPQVTAMAGLGDLGMRPVRRQKAFVRVRAEGLVPADAPFVVDLENHSYWRPEPGGLLCAWVDDDEPASEPSESLPMDWDFAAESMYRCTRLNPFFEQVADSIVKEDVMVSAGQYVYTEDDQPLIGPSEVDGLYLNCGWWCGVMMAPGAGKRVADLVTGKMDNKDNLLRPSRFAEGLGAKGDTFLK